MLIKQPYAMEIEGRRVETEITLSVTPATGEFGLHQVAVRNGYLSRQLTHLKIYEAARSAVACDPLFAELATDIYYDRRELSSMGAP